MSKVAFEKMVRDGKVAVLVSPGYGAGWATWADDDLEEFAMFDKGLVEMAERKATTEEVIDYLSKKLGESYFYVGGWDQIQIKWLPVGTQFTIAEYDGSESLRCVADLAFVA